ncbi:GH36-type glycosyl hydrolase domain-containing protein [Candidatus Chrysopegis kryptomonas]|uniref:Cellobiose phosphorylase n=1 Tax=Candidatus Chryseopegocella kryptomonas TaxID=1633643 RepID=A0A0P1MYS5_9BACT|nr:glycosyl transferase family 36 [Candidatus Chrysopegis kryptomonas]CUT01142.1 cellobiose phosphorylase [Candidatus Chrysopegis kryptomonas]
MKIFQVNKYGYFTEDGKEFVITDPRTPAPWMNYIWNGKLAGLVSHVGGGYTFYLTPRDNRLTRYRYNCLPWDQPGRYVYVRDEKLGRYFSLSWAPTLDLNYDFYECRHGLGYTKITTENLGLRGEITYFIPRDYDVEIWLVKIKNLTQERRELDIFAYIELVMGNALNDLINQPNDKHFPDVYFDRSLNSIVATRRYWVTNKGVSVAQPNHAWPYYLIFSTSLDVKGYDGDKETFIGRWRSNANPEAVENGKCFNTEITAGDPCAVLQTSLELEADEEKEFTFFMFLVDKPSLHTNERLKTGSKSFKRAQDFLSKFRDIGFVKKQFETLKNYWENYLQTLQVKTPDEKLNLFINIWNRYQIAVTFDMSRNAGYYHGGLLFGTGVRDQMQDIFGELIANPKRVKERLIEVCSYQFKDGSMLHNFFRISRTGEKTGHSDTPLWLAFGIFTYLKETGDFKFLNEKVEYYDGGSGTALQHLIKAIDYVVSNLGKHGLVKFGRGDWNDTLDYVGLKGKGETVWGSEFLAYILKEAVELFNYLGFKNYLKNYLELYLKISQNINKFCWDGKWYIRGFKDDGIPFGSSKNREGKIFANPQSWAVISGIADEERKFLCLDSVRKYLDTPKGPKILHPPYTKVDPTIGLATRCVPGKKENGAIFNHVASWVFLAELIAGNAERAYQIYQATLPLNNASDADVYKMEPYVYSEYVTSPDHQTYGEASHSWLTGSSDWFYKAVVEYMLGVRPTYGGLMIDPCVPSSWKSFSVSRLYRGARYEIEFYNPDGVNKGVKEIWINGKRYQNHILPVFKKGEVCKVKVVMGKIEKQTG